MGFENLTGQTLGQYELRELLGVGGMGAVYRAYQAGLQREVAVKILPISLAGEAGYIERFIREARTAGALEHPHIVRIYDYGTQGDISYLVMALLRGGSLAQRISQREEKSVGRPSLGEVAELLNQMASALDYAHHESVLHRDIKPANIMFDNHGRTYLSDFGIAKLMGANTALTGTGVAMGSPSYMPPEQWMGRELTPAADQYAMGVTIYQTLAGRLPFEADSAAQLMYKHFNEEPTPLNLTRAELPAAVNIVLHRSMAKDPEKRFPNMTIFAQAFEAAIEGNKGDTSNFFVYKLRQEKPRSSAGTPMPTPSSSLPARTGTPTLGFTPSIGASSLSEGQASLTPPPAPPSHRPVYQNPIVIVVGIVALALVILAAIVSDGGDEAVSLSQTAVAQILSQSMTQTGSGVLITLATDTAVLTATSMLTLTETPGVTPTLTETLTQTLTVAVTQTQTPSETPVSTDTATATATDEPTATLTPTDTATDIPTQTPTPTATTAIVPTQPSAINVTLSGDLAFGDSLIGTLDDAAPELAYGFTGTAGQIVTISLTARDSTLDPELELIGPDGTVLAENGDISGTDRSAQIVSFPLPADGDYIISAYRYRRAAGSSTGEFELSLTDDADVSAMTFDIDVLTYGEAVTGELDSTTPVRPYAFSAKAGITISLSVQSVGGGLDPAIRLIRIDGTPLAQANDISRRNRNAQIIDFPITEDGDYVVIIRRQRGTTGQFSLTLTEVGVANINNILADALRGCTDLAVGCVAVAQTPDKRALTLRTEPKASAASDIQVESGTEVILLEGPVLADGFRWWRIELSGGVQGWLVERLSLTRVLIPAE